MDPTILPTLSSKEQRMQYFEVALALAEVQTEKARIEERIEMLRSTNPDKGAPETSMNNKDEVILLRIEKMNTGMSRLRDEIEL